MGDNNIWHPCPGRNGKCVEKTPRSTKRALCVGCERGYPMLSAGVLEKRKEKDQRKDDTVKLKQALYHQLHAGLSERLVHLQGITDAVIICNILRLDRKDFVAFHRLAEKASKKKELSKLFDFVAEDGATFDAIYEHSARFQTYLAQEVDLPEQVERTLTIENEVVKKVYEGLLELQDILTTKVYGIKDVRPRTPPVLGSKGTKWGHPIVLFSKGKKDNKSVPWSAFVDQALHCDFQPQVANANARGRGKPVPYSVIINSTREDAIIHGCGLSPLEIIAMSRSTREPMYEDLPDPVKISIPTGCMVVFRGDYVHGGTSYAKNHTRLFMGMHLINDANGINTTCLEEDEKLPPRDIKGESTSVGVNRGNRSHRKRVSEASVNTKKRRAME